MQVLKMNKEFWKKSNKYWNYKEVINELKIIDSCNSLKRYLNICHSVDNKTITEKCNRILLKRYYTPKSKIKIVEILI